ncbi:hypothetical protein NMG60_11004008 [Bertholletia excelsa]
MFVFGDSLYDTGNNQYWNGSSPNAAGQFPYGETYFKRATGRASDGRLVPDFIAMFASLPLIPPYLQPGNHDFSYGTNMASGGAGALDETHPNTSMNLHTQLGYFRNVKQWLEQNLGETEARRLLRRSVFLFSIGVNDYFAFLESNPNPNISAHREFAGKVIANIMSVVREIYAMGGRKMAFQNVGPFGSAPISKRFTDNSSNVWSESLMAIARRHNRKLFRVLQRMESRSPGFKYSIFDFYNALYNRIKDPSKYGFKEVESACCGSGPYRSDATCGVNGTAGYEMCSNPIEYIFFDPVHPTEATNWQMAKLFWKGSPRITSPYNLKQLFKCL